MIPYLIFGCHNLTGGLSWRRSERLVRAALGLGIYRFDVAPSYGLGTAERTLGRALGEYKYNEGLEITTKYGILPGRSGPVKAYLREPYRICKSFLPYYSESPSINYFKYSSEKCAYPLSAFEAVHKSRRALGVECLSVFLSHECLPDTLCASFADDIQRLKDAGLIVRGGSSGEISNLRKMLAFGGQAAEIAQTSVDDLVSVPPHLEIRAYGMRRATERFCVAPQTMEAREALRDIFSEAIVDSLSGVTLAAVLAMAHETLPDCSFLINTGKVENLESIVQPLLEGRLNRWVETYSDKIKRHVFGNF